MGSSSHLDSGLNFGNVEFWEVRVIEFAVKVHSVCQLFPWLSHVENIHAKELNQLIEDNSGLFARIENYTLGFDTVFACYCLQWFLTLHLFGFSIAVCL